MITMYYITTNISHVLRDNQSLYVLSGDLQWSLCRLLPEKFFNSVKISKKKFSKFFFQNFFFQNCFFPKPFLIFFFNFFALIIDDPQLYQCKTNDLCA